MELIEYLLKNNNTWEYIPYISGEGKSFSVDIDALEKRIDALK